MSATGVCDLPGALSVSSTPCRPSATATGIDDLPRECMHNILSRVSIADRCSASLVCRRWFRMERTLPHDMQTEIDFWEQRLVLRRFPFLRTIKVRMRKQVVLPEDEPLPSPAASRRKGVLKRCAVENLSHDVSSSSRDDDDDVSSTGCSSTATTTTGLHRLNDRDSAESDTEADSATTGILRRNDCAENTSTEADSTRVSGGGFRNYDSGAVAINEVSTENTAPSGNFTEHPRSTEHPRQLKGERRPTEASGAAQERELLNRDGSSTGGHAAQEPSFVTPSTATQRPAHTAELEDGAPWARLPLTPEQVEEILDGSKFARLGAMGRPLDLQREAGTWIENIRICNCEGHAVQKGLVLRMIDSIGRYCPRMKNLDLHGTSYMDDPHFLYYCRSLPSLQQISLYKCFGLSDAGVLSLAHCSKLQQMSVASCPDISGSSVSALMGQCVSLRQVELKCLQLSSHSKRIKVVEDSNAAGVPGVGHPDAKIRGSLFGGQGSSLHTLVLRDCSIETSWLSSLCSAGIRGLNSLRVISCPEFSDSDLQLLAANAPHLKEIAIEGCEDIGDLGLDAVCQLCPRLEHLSLSGCGPTLTAHTLLQLTLGTTQLRSLKLAWCPGIKDMTESMVARFMRCHGLGDILQGAGSTGGVLDPVMNRSSFWLQGAGEGLTLRQAPEAEGSTDVSLGIERLSSVPSNSSAPKAVLPATHSTNGFSSLSPASAALPPVGLESVELAGLDGISDFFLKALGQKCAALRMLQLKYCREISSTGICELLYACPKLFAIGFTGFRAQSLGDVVLDALPLKCPLLQSLSLKACKGVTYCGVQSVIQGCGNFTCLQVSQCEQISVSSIRALFAQTDRRVSLHCGKCSLCCVE